MKYIVVLLLGLCFLSSCDKEEADSKLEIESSTTAAKYHFIGRSVGFSVSQMYVDSTMGEDFYLGSVWGLKDTLPNLSLISPEKYRKAFKIAVKSSNSVHKAGKFVPSFTRMRDYARKNQDRDGVSVTSSTGYSVADFFDYRAIRYYLNNSADVNTVLRLVKHNDSTTIRRKYGYLMHNESIAFTLMTQFNEFSAAFSRKDVGQRESSDLKPYYVNCVNYGTHTILMAESDYPRADFEGALDKLQTGQPLTPIDVAILEESDLLIYLRGGAKDSYIKQASGLLGIKTLITEFHKERKVQQNKFDFPISYSLRSLADFSLLKFWYSYDFLEGVEKE
ncbi:hypothetical protein AB3466_07545 [Sphingobacterium thalpophilum]|uniref:hypothetical protein n=1 Tax=Sphingobacterium thalpophilum TaxID=259 RepID=UPI0037DA02B0